MTWTNKLQDQKKIKSDEDPCSLVYMCITYKQIYCHVNTVFESDVCFFVFVLGFFFVPLERCSFLTAHFSTGDNKIDYL